MGIYGFYYLMWDFFVCLFYPFVFAASDPSQDEVEKKQTGGFSGQPSPISVFLGARCRPSAQVYVGPLTFAEYGQRSPPCSPHDSQGNKHRSE